MHPGRLVPTVVVLLALLVSAPCGAARVHLSCRDGIAPPLTGCAAGCVRPVRCDADVACDDTCTFAIQVCGEVECLDHIFPLPVGQRQRAGLATTLGAKPTRFVLRCLAHPRRFPCPTTTTSTSTSTSVTVLACPTTTTLGVPNCGGVSVCLGPCLSGQTCADIGGGQCGCAGPVLCGGTYSVCGGECPQGQTCTQLSVPTGCPSIGCTCQ